MFGRYQEASDTIDKMQAIYKEIGKIEKLAAENEGLPLAATMREYVSGLK